MLLTVVMLRTGFNRSMRSITTRMLSSSSPALGSDAFEADADVTVAEVEHLQSEWAKAITRISDVYINNGDYTKEAVSAANKLYGYGHTQVSSPSNPLEPVLVLTPHIRHQISRTRAKPNESLP